MAELRLGESVRMAKFQSAQKIRGTFLPAHFVLQAVNQRMARLRPRSPALYKRPTAEVIIRFVRTQ